MVKVYGNSGIITLKYDDGTLVELVSANVSTYSKGIVHYLVNGFEKKNYRVGAIGEIADEFGNIFVNDVEYYNYLSTKLSIEVNNRIPM